MLTKTEDGQTTTYSYDVLGNLREVTQPGGTHIEYVIDGRNRRIGKKVNGMLEKAFIYQSQLRPAAELDRDGNLVSRFIYAVGVNVPDFMTKHGTTYRIIKDHLGSPRLVVDVTTGAVAQRVDYDSWGNVTLDTNPGFQPFGFAGGQYDASTGMIRYGARDYEPSMGRWTTKDPILVNGGSSNFYQYAYGHPQGQTDPGGTGSAQLCLSGQVQALSIGVENGFCVAFAHDEIQPWYDFEFGFQEDRAVSGDVQIEKPLPASRNIFSKLTKRIFSSQMRIALQTNGDAGSLCDTEGTSQSAGLEFNAALPSYEYSESLDGTVRRTIGGGISNPGIRPTLESRTTRTIYSLKPLAWLGNLLRGDVSDYSILSYR